MEVAAPGDLLGGSSRVLINNFAWTALGLTTCLGLVLYVGQKLQPKVLKIPVHLSRAGVPRTPTWVLCSFLISYVMLFPGLFSVMFRYNLSGMSGMIELVKESKSMISFTHMLFKTGCWPGALLIILYAMVIPTVKLVLLICSEVWRRGSARQVMWARKSVHALQYVSKWAAPDMFAYVLILYLIRGLNHPPMLVAVCQMDIGFTCFSIFCVGSTVAALGLTVPPLPVGQLAPRRRRADWRCFARQPVVLAFFVALLAAAFAALLLAGLRLPVMSLNVSIGSFFKPNGPLDPSLRPIIELLNIEEMAHDEVNLWRCMSTLGQWALDGEANAFISFCLFALLVVVMSWLNMFLLLVTSLLLWLHPEHTAIAAKFLQVIKVFKKLAFLDVAVVGIGIVVVAGQSYSERGIVLHLRIGELFLLLAEVCHYIAYFVVQDAVHGSVEVHEDSSRGELRVQEAVVASAQVKVGNSSARPHSDDAADLA